MNPIRRFRTVIAALAAISLAGIARAQSSTPAAQLQQAIAFRQNLVSSILNNSLTASAAIAQLQATAAGGSALANRQAALNSGAPLSTVTSVSATGLAFASSDEDFEIAAIDIGHSLLSARRIPEAVALFQAAEGTLASMVANTPDASFHEKAQYLGSLALIRSRYLGEIVQAKSDITSALALEPGNKTLIALRGLLVSEHATLYASANGN